VVAQAAPGMWKLHRYYFKEATVNAVLAFAVLFGISSVGFLYKALAIVKGGNLIDAISTTFLLAVDLFPHLMNATSMFAVVLTYSRAAQDREMTAARSAGISPRVLMVPALHLGLLCAWVSFWVLHYEVPQAHLERFRIIAEAYKSKIDWMLRSQDRLEFARGGIMTWARREQEDGHDVYRDVSIFTSSQSISRLFGIPQGPEGGFYSASSVWFETIPVTGELAVHFENLRMPTVGCSFSKMSIQVNPVKLAGERGHAVGVKDLRSDLLLSEVYRDVHPDPVRAMYTVHRRSCFGIMPFLLAPIGFCIGMMFRDRGRLAAVSFCSVPIGTVYLIDFLSESLLREFAFAPVGWLPALVVFVAGVPFCWRLLRF
jgi:lipopolysaccharide export LptBFGC system permease protein LptF